MTEATKRLLLDDFLALPEEVRGRRAHFVDGEIIPKAQPSGEHGEAEFNLAYALGSRFRGKAKVGGRGGWWFQVEVSVAYGSGRRMITHDVAGWRRDRHPASPRGFPVRERPDWVGEVSFSSLKWDTRDVPRILEEDGVPHYWVLDVKNENLRVFALEEGRLVQKMSFFREDGLVRLPPFDAVPLSVGMLLGDDESNDYDENEDTSE